MAQQTNPVLTPAWRSDEERRRMRSLVTPEGVDLKLELAGAGERASAFLLDALFLILALIAFTFLAVLSATQVGDIEGGEIILVTWFLAFFFLRNFYFILFELGPRAATPGKRILGLRVASRDGGPLTANAIFARNAMREVEVFLPLTFIFTAGSDGVIALAGLIWSLIFVLLPLFNRDRLRAGDLIGGTWVVKAPRQKLVRDLAADAAASNPALAFTRDQLDAYGVHELHVLEDVLRAAQPEMLNAVAERIRTKIGWIQAPGETSYAFLSAYYPALRQRLEARLLMGVRRRDKHDRR